MFKINPSKKAFINPFDQTLGQTTWSDVMAWRTVTLLIGFLVQLIVAVGAALIIGYVVFVIGLAQFDSYQESAAQRVLYYGALVVVLLFGLLAAHNAIKMGILLAGRAKRR